MECTMRAGFLHNLTESKLLSLHPCYRQFLQQIEHQLPSKDTLYNLELQQ